jgi:hypothetical protein
VGKLGAHSILKFLERVGHIATVKAQDLSTGRDLSIGVTLSAKTKTGVKGHARSIAGAGRL